MLMLKIPTLPQLNNQSFSPINLDKNSKSLLLNLVGKTLPIQIQSAQAGLVTFQIQGQTFQASTQLQLHPSQGLLVNITQKNGQIFLQIQQSKIPNNDNHILKQLIPNQQSLQALFSQLQASVTNPTLSQNPALQGQLIAILDQLFKPKQDTNGRQLKKALENAGIGFENKLLKSEPEVQQDIKGRLFQLQQSIKELIPNQPNLIQSLSHLNQEIEQSINKITLNQLNLLDHPGLQAELPFLANGQVSSFQLKVIEASHNPHQTWQAMLTFSLIKPDDLQCKLILDDHYQLQAYFYSDDKTLLNKIQDELNWLEQRLADSGIHSTRLQISFKPLTIKTNPNPIQLIDVKV
jgi:arsenate reductase-like glutaredoxin family protein